MKRGIKGRRQKKGTKNKVQKLKEREENSAMRRENRRKKYE